MLQRRKIICRLIDNSTGLITYSLQNTSLAQNEPFYPDWFLSAPKIMILVRYHKEAPEFAEFLRKSAIYWVELTKEQTSGGQMTLIMSCVGAGLCNLVPHSNIQVKHLFNLVRKNRTAL